MSGRDKSTTGDEHGLVAKGQMLLDLSLEPSFSRDDLVVGKPNRAAISLIQQWPNWPSPFALLIGPSGSGKSHIAAIWRRETDALALDPEHLPQSVPPSVEDGKPVLIDGLGQGGFDETKLFHLMNAVRHAGSTVLMTSPFALTAWQVQTPDLLSRLKSATTIEIGEPDEAMLRAVLVKLFADRQVLIEPNVVDYLVLRIERSFAAAISVVDRLDRLALKRKCRITRSLAAAVIDRPGHGQMDLAF